MLANKAIWESFAQQAPAACYRELAKIAHWEMSTKQNVVRKSG